jgi:hypothetical protein
MLLPPINTSGVFKIAPPYDDLYNKNLNLKVTSIRNISDFIDNNEDPLNNIYIPLGKTEIDMLEDIKNEVPIVTAITDGGSYTYIPANIIIGIPDTTGVEYIEKTLVTPLGALPKGFDLTVLTKSIDDIIYDIINISTNTSVIDTSTSILITNDEHDTFMKLRENVVKVHKTNETKIQILTEEINLKNSKIKVLLERLVEAKAIYTDLKLQYDALLETL